MSYENITAENFIGQYNIQGRIPVVEVQSWIKENKGIPLRTFQLYAKEGLIPAPQFEGRKGYYKLGDFEILLKAIHILKCIKESPDIKQTTFLNIQDKYRNDLSQLYDILLPLVNMCPIVKYDDKGYHFSTSNNKVWIKILSELENGGLSIMSPENWTT